MHARFLPDESLLLRIAPLDSEYARLAGEVAAHLTGRRLLEAKDAHGHEHKGKGPGGGQFTHGQRAAALHARTQELAKAQAEHLAARHEAFDAVKAEATAANEQPSEHFTAAKKAFDKNLGYTTDNTNAQQPLADLDELLCDYDDDASVGERFAAFKAIEAAAKESLKIDVSVPLPDPIEPEGYEDDDPADKARYDKEYAEWEAKQKAWEEHQDDLTPEDAAAYKPHLQSIITHARAARQQLKAYVQHRREMAAIKSGEPMELRESAEGLDDAAFVTLLEAWDEKKHPRGQPGNAGEFGPGGGGKKPKTKKAGGKKAPGPSGESGRAAEPQAVSHAEAAADYAKNGTKAKAFKAWFGDWEKDAVNASKVVDAKGEPQETHGTAKKVYHGRPVAFDSFSKEKTGVNGAAAGEGFYFAEDKRIAETFADSSEGEVLEAYLSIKTPFDFDQNVENPKTEFARVMRGARKVWDQNDLAYFDEKVLPNATKQFASNADYAAKKGEKMFYSELWLSLSTLPGGLSKKQNEILRQAGYDGIRHRSVDVHGTPATPWSDKSEDFGTVWVAFAPEQIKSVANRGTFDPTSAKLAESLLLEHGTAHKPAGSPEGGQFTSGGGGAASKGEHDDGGPDHFSAAAKVKHAAHATHEYLHSKAAAGFHKLPTPVQKVISGALAVAFSGWTASQKIAERISIEKGSTPEQAAKLRSTLAAWDVVAFKPMAFATAPLGATVAAATWIVPPVTGVYLAHSAARHPLATFRAAKGLIKDAIAGAKKVVADHTDKL